MLCGYGLRIDLEVPSLVLLPPFRCHGPLLDEPEAVGWRACQWAQSESAGPDDKESDHFRYVYVCY